MLWPRSGGRLFLTGAGGFKFWMEIIAGSSSGLYGCGQIRVWKIRPEQDSARCSCPAVTAQRVGYTLVRTWAQHWAKIMYILKRNSERNDCFLSGQKSTVQCLLQRLVWKKPKWLTCVYILVILCFICQRILTE